MTSTANSFGLDSYKLYFQKKTRKSSSEFRVPLNEDLWVAAKRQARNPKTRENMRRYQIVNVVGWEGVGIYSSSLLSANILDVGNSSGQESKA